MGKVFLNPQGNGTAYCIPAAGTELSNNEVFELYCVPDSGATLEDIRAYDSYDHSVAVPTGEHVVIRFKSIWNNLYIDIYFTGSPEPPTPQPTTIPIWLLKKAADHNRRIY